MNSKMTRYAGIMMTVALSVNAVLAQEEAVEATSNSSIGLMMAILGIGVLVILGLGLAMNAQGKSEQE